MKNCGAVNDPGDPILLPRHLRSDAVDYECELAVVIGRPARHVAAADAAQYIAAYAMANDVTDRAAHHDVADGHHRRVRVSFLHPHADIGVDREQVILDQNLAMSRSDHLFLRKLKA